MKTLALAALVSVSLSPSCRAEDDLLRTFAHCTGRLSAQMEHYWLIYDARADAIEARRRAMIELLDLVVSRDTARHALNLRINAKMAQARLLTRATFNDDPEDAAWARRRAETEIAACASLLLG